MTLELGGEQVTVPCTRKALVHTDNRKDEPILNMDLIDMQLI